MPSIVHSFLRGLLAPERGLRILLPVLATAILVVLPGISAAQGDAAWENPALAISTFAQSTFYQGFSFPRGVAVDKGGNVYVADYGNNRIVRVAASGKSSSIDAIIDSPGAIAIGATGKIYFSGFGTVVWAFKGYDESYSGYGVFSAEPGAAPQFADAYAANNNCPDKSFTIARTYVCPYRHYGAAINGLALSGGEDEFKNPWFFASLSSGDLKVASASPSPTYDTNLLEYFAPNFSPRGIAFDIAGNFYVVDGTFYQVWKVTPGGVWSKVGSGYNRPEGVAVDSAGNVFVADFGNNRVVEVSAAGMQTAFGTGLSGPTGVAVFKGAKEQIFVTDSGNNRVVEFE